MAYEAHIWSCDETITADKLNAIENALAEVSQSGGRLIIRVSEEAETQVTYDRTWQEVHDALANGDVVMVLEGSGDNVNQGIVTQASYDSASTPHYHIRGIPGTLVADTADGYLYDAISSGGGESSN